MFTEAELQSQSQILCKYNVYLYKYVPHMRRFFFPVYLFYKNFSYAQNHYPVINSQSQHEIGIVYVTWIMYE